MGRWVLYSNLHAYQQYLLFHLKMVLMNFETRIKYWMQVLPRPYKWKVWLKFRGGGGKRDKTNLVKVEKISSQSEERRLCFGNKPLNPLPRFRIDKGTARNFWCWSEWDSWDPSHKLHSHSSISISMDYSFFQHKNKNKLLHIIQFCHLDKSKTFNI